MAAQQAGRTYACVATGCGQQYDPLKTRAGLRGFCSQACQDALAREMGWRRGRLPTQYSFVHEELHRRRATVPGAEPCDPACERTHRAERVAASFAAAVQPDETEAQALARVRPEHVAQAFKHVAEVNHYMVGVTGTFTDDELDAAEQLLISEQNALRDGGDEPARMLIELALDLVALERRTRRTAAARGGCPGCGTHDHAHSVAKHEASGIPVPQPGEVWLGDKWGRP